MQQGARALGPTGPGGGRGPGGRYLGAKPQIKDAKGTLKRLLGYIMRQKAALIGVFALVLIGSVVTLVNPMLIRTALNEYVLYDRIGEIGRILVPLAVLAGVGALVSWLQTYIMAGIARSMVFALRKDIFEKLMRLPIRHFDAMPHGDTMSRLTNDVDNINAAMGQAVASIIQSTVNVAGSLAMMFIIQPWLALTALVTVPLSVFLTGRIAKASRKRYLEQSAALGSLNGFIEESIAGQRVITAFAREPEIHEDFRTRNERLRVAGIRALMISSLVMPIMNMLNNIGYALVVGVGGALAILGFINVGDITAFTLYVRQFTRPINEIANQFNTLQMAIASAERVFALLDEGEEEDSPDAAPLGRVRGEVAFDAVTFGYIPNRNVLTDVTIDAQPGQTIALVGQTGAGKTTIVNLLMRFYDIEEGVIRIDGKNIAQLRLPELRRAVGMVLQDTHLFSDSVLENIRYGRLDATEDEIIKAAEQLGVDVFVRRMRDGYHTQLTEDGGNLSHGQRQLLSIARAVLAEPSILVLDEATSSVDTRTELLIQRAAKTLMKGRTSFVIAHRLSTIREADRILVIDGGRIVESGKHDELLALGGVYHDLYQSQFRRQVALEESVTHETEGK